MRISLTVIRYIGIGLFSLLLIKSFCETSGANVDNKTLLLVTLLLLSITISLTWNGKCKTEFFEQLSTPIVESVYAKKETNTETKIDPESGIDMNRYEQLKQNEEKVKEIIKSTYKYDMTKTTTNPLNTIPLGTQLYSYTYLPPENWFRAYETPPVCIVKEPCEVCPMTDPKTSSLLQYDTKIDVSGTKDVDIKYLKQKLNVEN